MIGRDIIWAGGEHTFSLRLGELRALQDVCNAGPEQIYNRITSGDWRVDDLYQTHRLGLVGGGMSPELAKELCDKVFKSHPLISLKLTAPAIISFALTGYEDDEPSGEEVGEANPL